MPGLTYHSRSLTELITNRAHEYPDKPAVYTSVSPSQSDSQPLNVLTYALFNRAVDRLAWHFARILSVSLEDVKNRTETRIVAVLVPSSIYESLLECALAKLGCCALLLSVNNSAPAVAHLCKLTKATTLIWGGRYGDRSVEAAQILSQEGITLELVEEKRFELWDEEKVPGFKAYLEPDMERDRPAVILHSSGSVRLRFCFRSLGE